MEHLPQLLNQPLPAEDLDLLQRSIECICGEGAIEVMSDAGDKILRRALILFYAGTTDESDLRQGLRRPVT